MQDDRALLYTFKNFDNLIPFHQCKLEHLQEQKKALLQQMFV